MLHTRLTLRLYHRYSKIIETWENKFEINTTKTAILHRLKTIHKAISVSVARAGIIMSFSLVPCLQDSLNTCSTTLAVPDYWSPLQSAARVLSNLQSRPCPMGSPLILMGSETKGPVTLRRIAPTYADV